MMIETLGRCWSRSRLDFLHAKNDFNVETLLETDAYQSPVRDL